MNTRFLPIAFGMTHAGKSLLWAGTDAFTLFLLIKVTHLPPVMAGGLFVLSSFWNAALDGWWGYRMTRGVAVRRSLPAICGVASVLACAAFAALSWMPEGAIAAAAVALFLFRACFSLLDVPHNATAAVLANRYGHLRVARWRSILGAVTGIMVAGAALPLIGAGPLQPGAARATFGVIALLALLLLAPLPWLVRVARRDPVPVPRPAIPSLVPGLAMFLLAQMIGFAALASMGKALLHADGLPMWLVRYAVLMLTVLRLAAIGIWSPLAARFGSARMLAFAYIVSGAATLALPVAIGAGAFALFVVFAVMGVSAGGVILLAWSRFSELLARHVGDDQASAARGYGLFTATSKIGLGASGLLTGAWLSGQSGAVGETSLWPLVLTVAALCLTTVLLGAGRMPRLSPRWSTAGPR